MVYYHANSLGSVVALTDEDGELLETVEYDVYGASFITQHGSNPPTGNRFLFTGREWDTETGLYHYRARAYSPSLGRFLQRDPIRNHAQYALVRNRPTRFLDPSGLQELENLKKQLPSGAETDEDLQRLKDYLDKNANPSFSHFLDKFGRKWEMGEKTGSVQITREGEYKITIQKGLAVELQLSYIIHEYIHELLTYYLGLAGEYASAPHNTALLFEMFSSEFTGMKCADLRKRADTKDASGDFADFVDKSVKFICDCEEGKNLKSPIEFLPTIMVGGIFTDDRKIDMDLKGWCEDCKFRGYWKWKYVDLPW